MPAVLNEAVPATTQNIDVEVQTTVTTAFRYTALLQHLASSDQPPNDVSEQILKEALINSRQHETFLRIILVTVRPNVLSEHATFSNAVLLRAFPVQLSVIQKVACFQNRKTLSTALSKWRTWNHNWHRAWNSCKRPSSPRPPCQHHKST